MKSAIAQTGRFGLTSLFAAGLLALSALSWNSRDAQAEADPADAEVVVNELASQVWSTFERGDLKDLERIDILTEQLEARTNVPLLARLTLGRYWQQLDDPGKVRYQRLFRDVVMRTLAIRLNQFARDADGTLEERFAVVSSTPAGRGDVLVRSTVQPESGDSLSVDWRLRAGDSGPVVIDVIIEGVSLLVSQRSEFASVIERSSLEGLLAELEARAGPEAS